MYDENSNTKKQKKYYFIFAAVTLLWLSAMIMIFLFSSKPADQSTLQSHAVDEIICNVVIRNFSDLTEYVKEHYIELIDKFVRKSAHFCEYMLLGFLTFWETKFIACRFVLKKLSCKLSASFIHIASSCIWCFFYACTDEIHQYFVPGRYSSFTDVLIDFAGSFVGIMIAFLIKNSPSKTK